MPDRQKLGNGKQMMVFYLIILWKSVLALPNYSVLA